MGSEEREKRNRSSRGKLLVRNNALILIFIAATYSTLICIFGPALHVVQKQHNKAKDLRVNVDNAVVEVEVEELAHEEMFRKTIKSCLPLDNSKCGTFVPPSKDGGSSKKVHRVAIIAPPGDLSSSIAGRVEDMKKVHNDKTENKDFDIQVIRTTHVPPYGYGKSHGLTKIVRLDPQPLVIQVTDALYSLLEQGESLKIITLADLKAALRQVIRFHCRLSHVAAHTALLSINFFEIMVDPGKVTHRIHKFLSPSDLANKNTDDEQRFAADDDQAGLYDMQEAHGARILTNIQMVSKVDVNEVLDQVLLEEMRISKNLTAWPCESFWTAGDRMENGTTMTLSPLTQRLARALSPDCDNDPYITCFVHRDVCEAKGDALCKSES